MHLSTELRRSLTERFEHDLRFFRGFMRRPKSVGSIIPTSAYMAKRMASVIDTNSGLPVLEIGPGTGVITRAILARGVRPENLYAVEYSPDFARHVRSTCPGVNVIEGDAFDLDTTLGQDAPPVFDCAISGLPLLHFPVKQRVSFLDSVLNRLPPGRPVIQFTYGPRSSIPPGLGNYSVEFFDFVIRNIPPAQMWIYRRGKIN